MDLAIRPPVPKFIEPARRLYMDAFPEEERRPWEQILKISPEPEKNRGPYLHTILFEKGLSTRFVGLLSIWYFDEFVYIEHFATMPALRNQGIGQSILEDMVENLDLPVVLEIERPGTSDLADRRFRFYLRAGFHPLDYDYIQPPYGPGLPSVPMTLMSTDPDIDPAQVAKILHTRVYAK